MYEADKPDDEDADESTAAPTAADSQLAILHHRSEHVHVHAALCMCVEQYIYQIYTYSSQQTSYTLQIYTCLLNLVACMQCVTTNKFKHVYNACKSEASLILHTAHSMHVLRVVRIGRISSQILSDYVYLRVCARSVDACVMYSQHIILINLDHRQCS